MIKLYTPTASSNSCFLTLFAGDVNYKNNIRKQKYFSGFFAGLLFII